MRKQDAQEVIKRLKNEADELAGRIARLDAFIDDHGDEKDIDKALLVQQLSAMDKYLSILYARIGLMERAEPKYRVPLPHLTGNDEQLYLTLYNDDEWNVWIDGSAAKQVFTMDEIPEEYRQWAEEVKE